jgi:hypothetical protein
VKAVARSLIEALQSNPLALALVAINLMFFAGSAYALREISASAARRDAVVAELIRCK